MINTSHENLEGFEVKLADYLLSKKHILDARLNEPVLLMEGIKAPKIVDNGEIKLKTDAQPTLEYVPHDSMVRFGMDLPELNSSYFTQDYTHYAQLEVIAYCRSLKLLEEVKKVDLNVLNACLTATGVGASNLSREYSCKIIDEDIGKIRREEILSMIPKNLDDIIASLEEVGIRISSDELDHELRKGNLIKTPAIEAKLKSFYEEKEKEELGRHGRIISVDAALSYLKNSKGGRSFLEASQPLLDLKTAVAFEQGRVQFQQGEFYQEKKIYLVAKGEKGIEYTLVVDHPDTSVARGKSGPIELRLRYGGKDAAFKVMPIRKDELGRAIQEADEIFPMFENWFMEGKGFIEGLSKSRYDAKIFLHGSQLDDKIEAVQKSHSISAINETVNKLKLAEKLNIEEHNKIAHHYSALNRALRRELYQFGAKYPSVSSSIDFYKRLLKEAEILLNEKQQHIKALEELNDAIYVVGIMRDTYHDIKTSSIEFNPGEELKGITAIKEDILKRMENPTYDLQRRMSYLVKNDKYEQAARARNELKKIDADQISHHL